MKRYLTAAAIGGLAIARGRADGSCEGGAGGRRRDEVCPDGGFFRGSKHANHGARPDRHSGRFTVAA